MKENTIQKVFNVVLLLIHLDGVSIHGINGTILGKTALLEVVHPENLGHYLGVALFWALL